MTPIHLEGFKFIDALMEWKRAEVRQQNRHWTIALNGKRAIRCSLTWRFGDSQLGGVDKLSLSAEEAVWLCLEEFRKWEEAYRDSAR